MKHFTRQQWEAFAAGQVKARQCAEMEEHLLVCDQCADLYLALISPADESCAKSFISPRFTSKVMQKISIWERKRQDSSRQKRNILYYVAVACLTLIFTSAGVFQALTQDVPKITRVELQSLSVPLKDREEKIIQFGWSEVVLENALSVLEAIKPH